MNTKRLLKAFIFWLVATFLVAGSLPALSGRTQVKAADGRVIYVDCTNDSGDEDGSADKPYKTVTKAQAAAKAGDRIIIRSCRYPEVVTFRTATTMSSEGGTATIGRFGPRPSAWESFGCSSDPGVDSDRDFISDMQEICIARYYHPVLILHEREDRLGWPSSVEYFLSGSRLLFTNTAFVGPGNLIRIRCQEETVLQNAGNQTALVNAERQVLDCTESPPQVVGTVRSDQKTPVKIPTTNIPTTLATLRAEFAIDPSGDVLHGLLPGEGGASIYTHVYPNVFGGVNIQYWYFFPYNGTLYWHEGDWEHITLRLDQNLEPVGAWYHHHNDKTWVDRGAMSFYRNLTGLHPFVYIAEQSHASYWSDGACDDGGVLNTDKCPNNLALWWFPDQLGAPTDRAVYLGGGLRNLGERGFEAFVWERFGGPWGLESGAPPIPGTSASPNPHAPLFKDDDTWLDEAAPFWLSRARR